MEANLCRFFYRLFIYIYIYITVGDPVPLTGLSLSYCCACPKPGHGFPKSYPVVLFINFVFSYLYILF